MSESRQKSSKLTWVHSQVNNNWLKFVLFDVSLFLDRLLVLTHFITCMYMYIYYNILVLKIRPPYNIAAFCLVCLMTHWEYTAIFALPIVRLLRSFSYSICVCVCVYRLTRLPAAWGLSRGTWKNPYVMVLNLCLHRFWTSIVTTIHNLLAPMYTCNNQSGGIAGYQRDVVYIRCMEHGWLCMESFTHPSLPWISSRHKNRACNLVCIYR